MDNLDRIKNWKLSVLRQSAGMAGLRKGIAALSTVLVIVSIVIIVSIIGAVIAISYSNSTLNERLASEALLAARAGAQDAIMKTIRYKNCAGEPCPNSYTLAVGANSAEIEVIDTGSGLIVIDSIGTARNRKKKIEVNGSLDQSTGEFKVRSFEEVPL